MTLRSRSARALVLSCSFALLAAGCGDDDEDADADVPATEEAQDATSTTAAPATEPDAAGAAVVEVVESDLGAILASDGRTLYVFDPDEGGVASNCYDDCASAWPPLLADGEVTVGEGLDAARFSTSPRDDGGEQVTVDGWPLYFFANDSAAGDTNGQGLNDVWWVVGPDGAAIQG